MPDVHRTRTTLAALLGAAAVTAGCATTYAAPPSADLEQRNAHLVREAFARGVGDPETFYAILADDVTWTVARAATPTTYTTRQQFFDDGAGPIVDRLTGQIQAEVHELLADDDQVVARWRGTATALDGGPYVNEYAWVMTMADERVTRVVAYLDLVQLHDLLARVPLPSEPVRPGARSGNRRSGTGTQHDGDLVGDRGCSVGRGICAHDAVLQLRWGR